MCEDYDPENEAARCFVCGRTGRYYLVGRHSMRGIRSEMRETERGPAHVDCLA